MIVGKIISEKQLEIPFPNPHIQGGTLFGKIVPPTISEEYIVNKGNEILNEILSELWISHTSEIIL